MGGSFPPFGRGWRCHAAVILPCPIIRFMLKLDMSPRGFATLQPSPAASLSDLCGTEGRGFSAALGAPYARCGRSVPSVLLEREAFPGAAQEFGNHGFVFAAFNFTLARYLDDVAHLLAAIVPGHGAWAQRQWKALRRLRHPGICTFRVRAECLGDDLALRAYLLGVRVALPLDAVQALPPIPARLYRWLVLPHDGTGAAAGTATASGAVGERSVRASAGEFSAKDSQAEQGGVAVVTSVYSQMLRGYIGEGRGASSFNHWTAPYMSTLFVEVFEGCLWRLVFQTIWALWAQSQLLELWWNLVPSMMGWFFAWRADALLIHCRSAAHATWLASEYSVIVFIDSPDDALLVPYAPGTNLVRLLMPIEPYWLLNWALKTGGGLRGEANSTTRFRWRARFARFFDLNGVCPVALDMYDLTWMAEHDAFQYAEEGASFDDRFELQKPEGGGTATAEGEALGMAQLAPLRWAPVTQRWLLPLLKPWRAAAEAHQELQELRPDRGLIMLARGAGTAQETWAQQELEARGFGVLLMPRRRGVLEHPRAVAHSLSSNHFPELSACRYVILVTPRPSAGQLLAEAALLCVLAIASPHKAFARLLFPPELHARTLEEGLARIQALEEQPGRAWLLRALVRGRAERLLSVSTAPPLHEYLRRLAMVRRSPGSRGLLVERLCRPPNVSHQTVDSEHRQFWLFAAGRNCAKAGSRIVGTGRERLALSAAVCARRCHENRGSVFVFNEVARSCRTYRRCKLDLPHEWGTDVFVLSEGAHSSTSAIVLG